MKRTAAHENALAKIRELRAQLAHQTAKYDRLRWHVSPAFGIDPVNSLSVGVGMLKRSYDDDQTKSSMRGEHLYEARIIETKP